MIQIEGKTIEKIGWAYSLLWICTTDDYSIHLYDNKIKYNGRYIKRGRIFKGLHGQNIGGYEFNGNWFTVYGVKGWSFSIHRCGCETARIFRRGRNGKHWIYRDGKFA